MMAAGYVVSPEVQSSLLEKVRFYSLSLCSYWQELSNNIVYNFIQTALFFFKFFPKIKQELFIFVFINPMLTEKWCVPYGNAWLIHSAISRSCDLTFP